MARRALPLIACALLLAFAAASTRQARDFDLLIRNARLFDGSGNPWSWTIAS